MAISGRYLGTPDAPDSDSDPKGRVLHVHWSRDKRDGSGVGLAASGLAPVQFLATASHPLAGSSHSIGGAGFMTSSLMFQAGLSLQIQGRGTLDWAASFCIQCRDSLNHWWPMN